MRRHHFDNRGKLPEHARKNAIRSELKRRKKKTRR
jgi:hypothetical protein